MPGREKRGTKQKRQWRIPPPLLRDASSPGPEGLVVLEEHQNDLGMVAWKTLRSVLTWADAPRAFRDQLFPSDLGVRRQSEITAAIPDADSPLRQALEDLLPVVSTPVDADVETIGAACARVAAWAQANHSPRTAIEFLQAAALCCPDDPRLALAVVRASRDLAQYSRAEAWFHRTVGLARQARDWDAYVQVYLAHGTMMLRKGSLPAARRSYIKALRRATRQGMRPERAKAYHDLFVLEDYMGNEDKAQTYAARAVDLYGPGHEVLPRLAHDVAFFWLQRGQYSHAQRVFQEVVKQVPGDSRATVLGSIARAAAGAGDAAAFVEARSALEQEGEGVGSAEAWVEVARGALMLARWDEASEAARYAEDVARRRREGHIRFMAESVQSAVEAERRTTGEVAPPQSTSSPVQEQLARKLVRALRSRRQGAPVKAAG